MICKFSTIRLLFKYDCVYPTREYHLSIITYDTLELSSIYGYALQVPIFSYIFILFIYHIILPCREQFWVWAKVRSLITYQYTCKQCEVNHMNSSQNRPYRGHRAYKHRYRPCPSFIVGWKWLFNFPHDRLLSAFICWCQPRPRPIFKTPLSFDKTQ